MTFRKIIKFGGTSNVVSLPKKWIERNNLIKGDVVRLIEEDTGLRIIPSPIAEKENDKEITLANADEKTIGPKILAAYLNNYKTINIITDDTSCIMQEVRKLLEYTTALEVIQQTQKKIVLRDFLNIKDISIQDILRRLDRIIMSMFEDVEQGLEGKEKKDAIAHKEVDANRLAFIVFKGLKRSNTSPTLREDLKIAPNEVFFLWEIALYLEKTADHLKRLGRELNNESLKETKIMFQKAKNHYLEAIKSYHKKDQELAIKVRPERNKILQEADEQINKYPSEERYLSQIKRIVRESGNISKSVINTNIY